MDPGRTIRVPKRFNGPSANGNGGYSCGVVAAFLEDPAEVNLRAPVPLDTPLAVEDSGDGVRVLDGETLIADGASAPQLEIGYAPVSTDGQDLTAQRDALESATSSPSASTSITALLGRTATGPACGKALAACRAGTRSRSPSSTGSPLAV